MAYVATGSTPPPGELESINSHHPLDSDSGMRDGIAMGFGIDAGMAAARFMFDIIKKYYLVKVFPECARTLQLIKDDGKGIAFAIVILQVHFNVGQTGQYQLMIALYVVAIS